MESEMHRGKNDPCSVSDAPFVNIKTLLKLETSADDSTASGGQDATVKLFDALSGQTLHVLSGLEIGTGSIAFSPTHQNLIAAGGWNGRLVIWNVYVCSTLLSVGLVVYADGCGVDW